METDKSEIFILMWAYIRMNILILAYLLWDIRMKLHFINKLSIHLRLQLQYHLVQSSLCRRHPQPQELLNDDYHTHFPV